LYHSCEQLFASQCLPAPTRSSCLPLVELVKAHAGVGRVQLQVKGRRPDGFLLVAGKTGEAVGKCVCDKEDHIFHASPGMIRCINSSNKGTVNAVSP